MSRIKRPLPPLYLDVDDEPLPPGTKPDMRPWSEKIAPLVDKVLNNGDFIHEVHCDGKRFVSLLTVDATGDNTLVYLTRADATKLIAKLQLAVDGLPQRKTTGRRKKR